MGKILHHLIVEEQLFSLEVLNQRITFLNVDLSTGVNVPPAISRGALDKQILILSASEMSFLIEHLSICIGDLIPEGHKIWNFFLTMRKMISLFMNAYVTEELCDVTNRIIREHHKMFIDLFDSNLTPKYHFLLHYPRAMKKLGPLRYFSCMSFEARHKSFKRTANTSTSRANPAHTLALKNQLNLCHRFLTNESLKDCVTFGVKSSVQMTSLQGFSFFRSVIPGAMSNVVITTWVKWNDTRYKPSMLIYTNLNSDWPQFGKIEYIFVDENNKITLLIREQETVALLNHYQAYEIRDLDRWSLLKRKSLADHTCFNSHILESGKICILCS